MYGSVIVCGMLRERKTCFVQQSNGAACNLIFSFYRCSGSCHSFCLFILNMEEVCQSAHNCEWCQLDAPNSWSSFIGSLSAVFANTLSYISRQFNAQDILFV